MARLFSRCFRLRTHYYNIDNVFYMGTTSISTLGASYAIVPSLWVIKEILAMHSWNNSIPKMIYSCSSASRADWNLATERCNNHTTPLLKQTTNTESSSVSAQLDNACFSCTMHASENGQLATNLHASEKDIFLFYWKFSFPLLMQTWKTARFVHKRIFATSCMNFFHY